MKKFASAAVMLLTALCAATANAAYSQLDIQNAVESAFSWQEANAAPRNSAGSSASDYYITALSRMNKSYDFSAYSKLIEKLNPSTKQDGQRLVITSSACGDKLSDSFVGWYTYEADFDSAADIAGAIITLESGGYTIPDGKGDINNLIGKLLTMQQSNGSFGNDVMATAKSVIALSNHVNTQYQLTGTHDDELYKYDTNTALENAKNYLADSQQSDGGYSTITATAYVITALDSIGTDADTDSAFVKNGVSPIGYIISHQDSGGSVNSSPDDTAAAAMAYVSHLRAMQGKSKFFDFTSGDTVSQAEEASSENLSGNSTITGESTTTVAAPQTSATAASDASSTELTKLSPPATKEPEHSSLSEEEYGPFQFVGPIMQTQEPNRKSAAKSENDYDTSGSSKTPIAIVLIIAAFALVIFGALTYIRKNPKLSAKLEYVLRNMKKQPSNPSADEVKESSGTDLIDDINAPHEVVPEDELYDPDFIKKLIPVETIDDSIDSLIPSAEDTETLSENNE